MFALLVASLSVVTSGHSFRYIRTQNANASKALIVAPTFGIAESCSAADDLAKNFVVNISNDKPTKGEQVSTTFDFDLDAPITGGTAYYSVTLNGAGPYASNAPLCTETAKTNDPCPLAVGHHHEVSTTANTVTGKVVTTITWKDTSGTQILCARITTKSS